MDEAACKGMAMTHGYDLFYDPARAAEAKSICETCNVRLECLRCALEDGVWDGVYGGLTPEERTSHYRRWRYWCKQHGKRTDADSLDQWNQRVIEHAAETG